MRHYQSLQFFKMIIIKKIKVLRLDKRPHKTSDFKDEKQQMPADKRK